MVVRSLGRVLGQRSVTQGFLPSQVGSPNLLESLWPFAMSESGEMVTPDTILRLSALWRAVNIIANTCAMMPLKTYAKKPDGGRMPIELPAERHIWDRPNPEVNKFVFWSTVFLHQVMNGNAFLVVHRRADGGSELWPQEPRRVQVGRNPNTRKKVYLLDGTDSHGDVLDGGDVIHIPALSMDGLVGMSLVKMAATSMGISLAANKWASKFFSNTSAPGGYLTSDQELNATQSEQISVEWEKRHRGVQNSHRLAVMGKGTKWMSTMLNPEDAMLLSAITQGYIEVSNWTGVPAFMVGAVDKQTSWGTGVAQQFQGLRTYTLDPYLVNAEMTISDEALPEGHYAKFTRGALLRMDPAEQSQVFERLERIGMMSQNEGRELLDLEPIKDPSADEYWLNSAMRTTKSLAATQDGPAVDAQAQLTQIAGTSPDVNVATQALNGAQIASLLEVLQQVTAGVLSDEVAKTMLEVAFPFIAAGTIESMVNNAASFEPKGQAEAVQTPGG